MLTQPLRRVLFADTSKTISRHATILARQSKPASIYRPISTPVARAALTACNQRNSRSFATASTLTPKPKRTPVPKKAGGAIRKPAAKKRKLVKKKPKKKPKKKVVAKKKPRKQLTAEQLEKQKAKSLRAVALVKEQPSLLTDKSKWLLFLSQNLKGTAVGAAGGGTKQASQAFKALDAAEIEQLNRTLIENQRANEAVMRQWVRQYTVAQIQAANRARRAIRRISAERSKRGLRALANTKGVSIIVDDRIPKKPAPAYVQFYRSRWNSGDFKSLDVVAANKLASQEWKALSPGEKQVHLDTYNRELEAWKRTLKAA